MDAVSIPAIATAMKVNLVEEYVICVLLSNICSLSRVSEESPGDVVNSTRLPWLELVIRTRFDRLAVQSAFPPIATIKAGAR